jgi:hypothetical protein
MFSYPNLTPLPAAAVQAIGDKLSPLRFDRIYGAFWDRVIRADARKIVRRSVARYLEAIGSRP